MILCLDAGNTRLKWGIRAASGWCAQGACAYDDWEGMAAQLPGGCRRLLACNVAGDAVAARIETLASRLGLPCERFRSRAAGGGVTNGYDRPEQLGADRWAALIGAHALHAGPALVVMAGTATTVDVLTADGHFAGGLILPGLDLMRQALARNTAGLPVAQGSFSALPTNTDDAIVSGILHATLGAIERLARRAAEAPQHANFLCVLSGGAAERLQPHLGLPLRRVDNLVLEGLAQAAGQPDGD